MGTGAEPVADDVPAEAIADIMAGGAARPSGPAGGIGTTPLTPKEPVFLIVARVMRPHGTQGEVGCEIITEFPERFRRTKRVFLSRAAVPGKLEAVPSVAPREYSVEQARLSNHRGRPEVILKLGGVTDRDTAETLRGWLVQVPEAEAWKLPRGRFYWHQILGLRVVTTEGEEIGTVAEILETGANDVYVVKGSGGERLIPAITQVVKWINPARGEIRIELLPGL
jgi:16S rRNA processing protein RimM